MCFHLAATSAAKTLEARFDAMFPESNLFEPAEDFNAFAHPELPVITSHKADQIELFHWGMVPAWVRDNAMAMKLKRSTLNARIETAHEKPSFQESYRLRRCIIPATAFYEWQHLSIKTKIERGLSTEIKIKQGVSTKEKVQKVKFKITTDQEVFAFAGLWDTWKDPETHEEWNGFSILTMPANDLMAKIHNSACRMPLILRPENEKEWLNPDRMRPEHLEKVVVPYPENLMHAEKIG